jgi:NitT/TauT family transport system substrate-binding protein
MLNVRNLLNCLFCLVLLLPGLGYGVQPLRLGTNVWPGYEPLYLAAQRENWRQRLQLRLVEYPSATEVIRAFRNRALEAAALTLDEVLVLQEAGLPLKVITVLDISAGGDVILAKPEIAEFAQLRGRRIGVEGGALGAYVLTRALELNQMNIDQVQVVNLDVSAHEGAYLTGEIDAAVTFEPVRTRLLAAGARELFSSRQIPGEIVDVLVVHEEVLARDRARFAELVAGWFRALAYMAAEPAAAAEFTAQRLKVSPQEVLASYQGLDLPGAAANARLLGGELQPVLQRLQQTMLRKELLLQVGDTRQLLDAGLLPE